MTTILKKKKDSLVNDEFSKSDLTLTYSLLASLLAALLVDFVAIEL